MGCRSGLLVRMRLMTPLVASSRSMCVWVNTVVQAQVGLVTAVDDMGRMMANQHQPAVACLALCPAQTASVIMTKMYPQGDMCEWASVVYVSDTRVSLGRAPALTLTETTGPRTESSSSSSSASAATKRPQQRLSSSAAHCRPRAGSRQCPPRPLSACQFLTASCARPALPWCCSRPT